MKREIIEKELTDVITKLKQRTVIMMEHPVNSYFEMNSSTVKLLTNNGFQGIYISFQRPFKNVFSLFETEGIDIDSLLIIDAATALSGEKYQENIHCIHVSQALDIDELVKAIYTSLSKLKSQKKFIFIDSLTTIALYKPLSETLRFSEFLMATVLKKNEEDIILIFNVAKDLAQKKFIRDIAFSVDQIISVENND